MKETEKAEYVRNIVSEAITLGITMANRCYEPQEDKLKKKDISRWTKSLGIEPSVIRALKERNMITEYRVSDSPNAARYYSLVEIKKALFAEHIRTGWGGKFYDMSFLNF